MPEHTYYSPHDHMSSIYIPNEDRTSDDMDYIAQVYYDKLYKIATSGLLKWTKQNFIPQVNKFLRDVSNGKYPDYEDYIIDELDLIPEDTNQWFYDNIIMYTASIVNSIEDDPVEYATYMLENSYRDSDDVIDEIVYEITRFSSIKVYTNLIDRYASGKPVTDDECDEIADLLVSMDEYITQDIVNKAINIVFDEYLRNPIQNIKQLFVDIPVYEYKTI